MSKMPAAALFKISCIPNTLQLLPTGLHVKICSRGWGGKIQQVWTHTHTIMTFLCSVWLLSWFLYDGWINRLHTGMPHAGKNLKTVSTVSILSSCFCVRLLSAVFMHLSEGKISKDTTEDCSCSFSATSRDHRRSKTYEQHTSASQKHTPKVEALNPACVRLWLAQWLVPQLIAGGTN